MGTFLDIKQIFFKERSCSWPSIAFAAPPTSHNHPYFIALVAQDKGVPSVGLAVHSGQPALGTFDALLIGEMNTTHRSFPFRSPPLRLQETVPKEDKLQGFLWFNTSELEKQIEQRYQFHDKIIWILVSLYCFGHITERHLGKCSHHTNSRRCINNRRSQSNRVEENRCNQIRGTQ